MAKCSDYIRRLDVMKNEEEKNVQKKKMIQNKLNN